MRLRSPSSQQSNGRCSVRGRFARRTQTPCCGSVILDDYRASRYRPVASFMIVNDETLAFLLYVLLPFAYLVLCMSQFTSGLVVWMGVTNAAVKKIRCFKNHWTFGIYTPWTIQRHAKLAFYASPNVPMRCYNCVEYSTTFPRRHIQAGPPGLFSCLSYEYVERTDLQGRGKRRLY